METYDIISDPNYWGSLTDRIQAFSSVVSLLILMWSLRSLKLMGIQNKLLKEQNASIMEQTKLTRLQMSDANMPQFETTSIFPQYSVNFIPGSQTVLFQLQNLGSSAYKISISTWPQHLKCTVTPESCPPESWINLSIDTEASAQLNELISPITAYLQFENFLGDRFSQRAILSNGNVTCTNVERLQFIITQSSKKP